MLDTSASDEASLLAECRLEVRSLPSIERLINALKSQQLPAKPRKMIVADWLLEYASDMGAVARFTGEDLGPFAVTEGLIHRFMPGNAVESIQVVRRFGPFGNFKRSLNGRWSLDESNPQAIRWRYTYQVDSSGREREMPGQQERTCQASIAYMSPSLLILTFCTAGQSDSVTVFSHISSLEPVLVEFRVAAVPSLGDEVKT